MKLIMFISQDVVVNMQVHIVMVRNRSLQRSIVYTIGIASCSRECRVFNAHAMQNKVISMHTALKVQER